MVGEHLQAGQILQAFVHHGPDPPPSLEVELGQEAEVVHGQGAVVPDYQAPALHWDVLQALDGVFVPQLQVTFPQFSRVPSDKSSSVVKDKSSVHT